MHRTLFLPVLFPLLSRVTTSVPLSFTIPQRTVECLYDRLLPDEYVTMSVFITAGSELRAIAAFEGPVALLDASTGKDLQDSINAYERGKRYGKAQDGVAGDLVNILERHEIDFEHLNPNDALSEEEEEPDDYDDDDDAYADDDELSDEEREARKEKRKKEREAQTARRDEARNHRKTEREKKRSAQQKKLMVEGEPFQKTWKIVSEGWYRVCVRASYSTVSAEIEMRKSSEVGPPNKHTGHLISYDRRAMVNDEKSLFQEQQKVAAAKDPKKEEGNDAVKDQDLKKTRDQLKKIHRLLNDIKEKQQNERHRLSVHAATNEHSHSRMVLSSLFETLFYMVVSGFQVYTIRKWFSGAPMLGV